MASQSQAPDRSASAQSTDYFSDEGYGISSSVLTGCDERVPAVSPKLHQEQHSDFRHHSLPASVAYGEGAPVSEALDSMMKRIPGSGNTVHSDSPIYMASTFSRDSVPVDGKPRTVLGIGHRRRQPSFQGLAEVEHREAVATSQRSKQGRLLEAVMADNPEILEVLLQGTQLENEHGRLILVALQEEKNEAAKVLLRHGISVKVIDKEGRTPLHLACGSGSYHIVRILLHKADFPNVNTKAKDGATPLLAPAGKGFSVVVETLLENGADPNIPDKRGCTPLIAAASECESDVIKALLKKGADVHMTTVQGVTALQAAVTSTHPDKDKVTKTTLMLAEAVVASDRKSQQLFSCKSVEELQKLIKSGARIQYLTGDGKSALMVHCERGGKEITEELCRQGAPIDTQDKDGRTALMHASSKGHLEVVRLLIVRQAIVDLRCAQRGWTALFYGVQGNHVLVVKELVSAGASLSIKDKDDKDPLSLAKELGHTEIITFIEMRGTTATERDDPFNQLLGKLLEKKGVEASARPPRQSSRDSPKMSRKKALHVANEGNPPEAPPNVQTEQLEKAWRRIADLEGRIQDMTLQSTYSQTASSEEDLSYLPRERLEEELRKARTAKKKSDHFAVDAKVTAQRLSAENYQLKEKVRLKDHEFQIQKKTFERAELTKGHRTVSQEFEVLKKKEFDRAQAVIQKMMVKKSDPLSPVKRDQQIVSASEIKELLFNGKVSAHFLLLAIAGLPTSGKSALYDGLLGNDTSSEHRSLLDHHTSLKDTRYAEVVYVMRQLEPSTWLSLREHDSSIIAVTMGLSGRGINKLAAIQETEPSFSNPLLRSAFSTLLHGISKVAEKGKVKLDTRATVAFLNVIDFGVNRAVYEIIPLIAKGCGRMILLNLLNLSRDADMMRNNPDLSRYSTKHDDSHLMQLRSRLHYLLYIASVLMPTKAKPGSKAPKVLLVGTHSDKLHVSANEVKSEVRKLRKAIDVRAAESGIDKIIQPGMPAIDTTSSKGVTEVKGIIEAMIEAQDFKVDMPLKWLFLRRVLHHYTKERDAFYIPREELVDYAQKCEITEEESLQEFLTTFKDGGSIIFCSRIRTLARNIIIDPVRFVQELEKLYYPNPVEESRPDGTARAHNTTSLSHGIICENLAEILWGRHVNFFLEILQDVHLATALDESYELTCPSCTSAKCYYMPSLCEKPYQTKPSPETNSLFVVFDTDYVPAHIQTHFVRALGEKFRERIELETTDYYNMTSFVYHHPSDIKFNINVIFHGEVVEVQVKRPSVRIRRETIANIYSTLKTLTVEIFTHTSEQIPGMELKLAVLCPHTDLSCIRRMHFIPFHACLYPTDPIVCTTCNHRVEFSELTKLWISATYEGPCSTSFTEYGQLSLTEIERITRSFPVLELNPQLLGEALELTPAKIQESLQLKAPNRVAQMIAEWQGRCACHTRQCLGEILMGMGHYREALWLNPKLAETKHSEPRQLSESELAIVAQHVGNWQELGSHLGALHDSLQIIQREYRRQNECCYEMLRAWRQGQIGSRPFPATRDELIEVVGERMGYRGLADFLKTGSTSAVVN